MPYHIVNIKTRFCVQSAHFMRAPMVNPINGRSLSATGSHIGSTGEKTVPPHLHRVAGPADNTASSIQTAGEQYSAASAYQSPATGIGIDAHCHHPLLITAGGQSRPAGNNQRRPARPPVLDKLTQSGRIPANQCSGGLSGICQQQERTLAPLETLHPLDASPVPRHTGHAGKRGGAVSKQAALL